MKIACVSLSAIPSKTANSIQAMKAAHALAQLGYDVSLIVPAQPGDNPTWDDLATLYGLAMPFPVEWLPARSRRFFTWQAVRRACALRAEVLYTWAPQSAVFGLLHGLPTILEIHDLPSGRIGPWWYRVFLRLPGRKRMMVITRALQKMLDGAYGEHLLPRDVILAPNGIEPERYADLPAPASARRQIGIPEAPTIACTGHLYAGRGADVFLALAQAIPQAQFLWAGGKPEDVDLWKSKAAEMNLKNVIFLGFVENQKLPLYQAAAEILLMPYGKTIGISSGGGNSAAISSPMKMFEYMAAGRAIVSSDLPVFHEVLNEKNAVFCPPDDIPAWVQAVGALLSDPARQAQLSAQARVDVRQYSWVARAQHALDGFI